MKLSDLESAEHGTSLDLNFTHPVLVKNTSDLSGVGTSCTSCTGGINTDTIKSPVITPTKTQSRDIIILILVYCKMNDTGPTGPTGPVYLMTLDQLVQYHDTTAESEAADKVSMNFIIQPSTSGIQQNLIQWASAGFPVNYQVLSVALIHPIPCSDGTSRGLSSYIQYLTGSDISTLVTNFQSNFLGITFSHTISGNILNLQASKA